VVLESRPTSTWISGRRQWEINWEIQTYWWRFCVSCTTYTEYSSASAWMCWYHAYWIDGLRSSGGQPYVSALLRWIPSRYQKNGYIYSFPLVSRLWLHSYPAVGILRVRVDPPVRRVYFTEGIGVIAHLLCRRLRLSHHSWWTLHFPGCKDS
jgi:hypothetical protein